MFDSDHYVTLIFHNSIDSSSTEAACQDTVVGSRATTTLQVTSDRHTYIVLRVFVFHTFGIMHGSSGQFAFGYQYNTTVF